MSRIVISFSDKGPEHIFRAVTIVELVADHHDVLLIVPQAQCPTTTELCRKYPRIHITYVIETELLDTDRTW